MDTQNYEQMAREYKNALATIPAFNGNDSYLEQIIVLSESQLDILNYYLCNVRTAYGRKLINYLKTLTYQTLVLATKLLDGSTYSPLFRNPVRTNTNNAVARLINDQIDIFILLDKLALTRTDLAELSGLENRKMAILAAL